MKEWAVYLNFDGRQTMKCYERCLAFLVKIPLYQRLYMTPLCMLRLLVVIFLAPTKEQPPCKHRHFPSILNSSREKLISTKVVKDRKTLILQTVKTWTGRKYKMVPGKKHQR